jgi:putative ABC transport system permease protein
VNGPIRRLLRFLPPGDRRAEIESDLTELFDVRLRERGRVHAYWRLLLDISSLVVRRRPFASSAVARDRSGGVGAWLLDLRYGLRLFRKHPAIIGATVAGLALAIAVGTTVFAILNASLIRPYGMADPSSVVRVHMLFEHGLATEWPYHAFEAMRERAHNTQLAASIEEAVRFAWSAGETPSRVDSMQLVNGGYFPTLGGRAILGRTLLPSDDAPGAVPVVVVNHRFWTSRLNRDAAIIGKTIWLSGSAVTVVGVIASSFTGPVSRPPAFWAPFGSYGAIYKDRPLDRTSATHVRVIARVVGAERAVAEQELSAIAAGLPDAGIPTESGTLSRVTGVRLDGAASPMDGSDNPGLLVAIGVVMLVLCLVLALACANVANLLLAGAAARTREIGMRLALGASPRRILRQLLGESVLIGLMAGGAGLVLSLWLVPIVVRVVGLPDTYDVRPDTTVILFTAIIAVCCGTAAGLAPARYGSRSDLLRVLKSQGAQASSPPKAARMRRVFIGFQAAASVLLLVTAALFLRAAVHAVRVDLGFDADKLAAVEPAFPRSGFDERAAQGYWRSALERVRAMPTVERVSLTLYTPFGGSVSLRDVPRLRRSGLDYTIYQNSTDADYFATAGFHLVRGRAYSADEVRASAPVAVVSESIVRDFLGATEPIGASLGAVAEDLSPVTIIGVVAEAMTGRLRGIGNGVIYRPLRAADIADARLVIRTARPEAIVRDLESVLTTIDPRVRPNAALISTDVDRYMNEPKILAGLSGAVAGLALVLAVLGVYGVTTFVVSQRMWEMHVRQAIGASTRDIVRLLVRQNLTPVLVGLMLGLAIALAAVRVLTPALSGLSPYDPAAITGAVAVLLAAAIAAVVPPALRAARSDPAEVLRHA